MLPSLSVAPRIFFCSGSVCLAVGTNAAGLNAAVNFSISGRSLAGSTSPTMSTNMFCGTYHFLRKFKMSSLVNLETVSLYPSTGY